MNGLPKVNDKVKIWPFPGRRVQNGPRPVDALGGGRWLSDDGELVYWSAFHLDQLRAGDILLHPPKGKEHTAPTEDDGVVDVAAIAQKDSDELEAERAEIAKQDEKPEAEAPKPHSKKPKKSPASDSKDEG